MSLPVLVVGHKNPDNDSICAAVGYAYLKNELAKREAELTGEEPTEYLPARLGPLPAESAGVLEQAGIEPPVFISHVYARVSDVMETAPISINENKSLLEAAGMLYSTGVNGLVVIDDDGLYRGLITRRMMGERYLAATDSLATGASQIVVAADLIASLDQHVKENIENDVLILDKDDQLNGAIDALLDSDLREAVVLDEEGYAVGFLTRSTVAKHPKRRVILVDHNERRQAANGIDEADVLEIVDHHRIGDISTTHPIRFLNLPVGSTATIVVTEFDRCGVELPKNIAEVLLSAIMTDTVMLKSPTTTEIDRKVSKYLGTMLDCNPIEYGKNVFRMRGNVADISVEKLVTADSKEFTLEDGQGVCLIAQYETVDLPAVIQREGEIREYMQMLLKENGYEFVLLMATDIMAEGSQFFCEGDRHILNRAFDISCTGKGGTWMPGILSRKKQVAARILGA